MQNDVMTWIVESIQIDLKIIENHQELPKEIPDWFVNQEELFQKFQTG